MKKTLLLLLALLALPPVANAADGDVFTVGDFVYKILSESSRNVELSKCWGRPSEVQIQSDVTSDNGTKYTIVTIGDRAFADNTKLTSITMPPTVGKIGKWAFAGCKALTSIEISHNVTVIEEGTFSGCEALESVDIPPVVTSIGDFAFSWCQALRSVTFPASITDIGAGVFQFTNLSEIRSLPSTPPAIKSYTFDDVSKEVTVYVPATSIELYRAADGWSRFTDYQALMSAAVGDYFTVDDISYTVLSSEDFTVEVELYYGNDTRLEIPSTVMGTDGVTYTVTAIGEHAFFNFFSTSTLSEIILPPTITSIGTAAFLFCGDLTSMTIPASVNVIGECAFAGCESLNEFIVDDHNTAFSTHDGMLYNHDKTRLIACPGARSRTVVAASVTSISPSAFFLCSRLESIGVEEGNKSYTSSDGILYNADMTILTACPGQKAKVTIPASVTAIGDVAFGGCWLITDIDIPASVTYIGDMAFILCQSLRTVTVPSSVTYIGGSTFENCGNLTSVELNAQIKSISAGMFNECSSLSHVNIPPTVTSIEEYAFRVCTSLPSISIPASVTSISATAFEACENMNTITSQAATPPIFTSDDFEMDIIFAGVPEDAVVYIPAGSQSLYMSAEGWSDFHDFREVDTSDGAEFTAGDLTYKVISEADHTAMVTGYIGNPTNIDIPMTVEREHWADYSVTSIKGEAFKYCWSLRSVTLPESLSTLPNGAFWNCTSLTKIVSLRSTPPTIGYDTFSGVPADAVVYIPVGSMSRYESANYWKNFRYFREMYPGVGDEFSVSDITYTVISETDHRVEVSHYSGTASSLDIPSTVRKDNGADYTVCRLGSHSFQGCESLTSVSIPSTVTYIGDNSFARCTSLASVSIPSSVSTIGDYAFWGCTELSSITIPESVASINNYAFYGCTALSYFTIPQSVATIGEGVFSGCIKLESINVDDGNPYYSSTDGVLYSYDKTEIIVWPAGKTQTEVVIPDYVKKIGPRTFDSCASIVSVKIPSSVTSISRMAFYHCSSLKSIVIPQGITTLSMQLFEGCTSLESVTLPASLTNIQTGAFSDCRSIKKIVSLSPTPPSLQDKDTFRNVSKDAVIYVPAGSVESYSSASGWSHFHDFREIANSAGDQFTVDDITYTVISASEYCVEVSKYHGYSSDVKIPASVVRNDFLEYTVTSVGANAFSRCTFIKSVTIPQTVTSIADNAFWGCLTLTELVVLPVNPPVTGASTFDYVPTDAVVYVPAESLNRYKFDEGWSYFHNFRELNATGLVVGTDCDPEATEPEFYNLKGMRIDSELLPPGIYIMRQGNTVRKIIVK